MDNYDEENPMMNIYDDDEESMDYSPINEFGELVDSADRFDSVFE